MELLHQPGDIIALRYQIGDILGQGGIGITYQAVDLKNERQVAIKKLSLQQISDWKVLELFEREARILSQLNHSGIPQYLDYFQVDTPDDRKFYLVQELAAGESLATLVEKGWHARETEVKLIAEQVLSILSYLQEFKPPVIHRDIKPQNIIMRSDGKVFLVDFGAVQDTYRQTAIASSTIIGTYGYMAPEQFWGQAYPATDLYGLATTILFLLTHQSPSNLPQHRLKVDFRSKVQISPSFADWLETMLEPVAEDRFPSAKEALSTLKDEINSSLKKHCKPSGSRIRLKQTPGKLVLEIPPMGWQFDNVSGLGFALIWSGFLFLWTSSSIAVGTNLFFPLFSIPFWIIGLGMLGNYLFSLAGCTRLEIDRENFRLQWQLLGFSHQVKGRTVDIKQVEIDISNYRINDRPIVTCKIIEEVRNHRFGSWLAQAEKEWLIEEITNFLNKKNG